MSNRQFRRGIAAIKAAIPPQDVYEALDRLDVDVIEEKGGEVIHTCPECDSEYARTNVEAGLYFCPCGWQGRHWLGGSSNGSTKPKRPDYDIEPVWDEGIEPSPSPVAEWDYEDEHGNVVQTIHREEKIVYDSDGRTILNPDGSVKRRKSFPVSRIKNGRLIWAQPAKWQQVPYRLPELLAADPAETVWVTEGEKDADSLAALGLVATCEPGYVANSKEAGRTLLWGRGLEEPILSGRCIKLVADRDRVGLKKALALRDGLSQSVASVEILLPAVGKDVSDHLHNGRTLGQLVPLSELIASSSVAMEDDDLAISPLQRYSEAQEKEWTPLMTHDDHAYLHARTFVAVIGEEFSGKSFAAMWMCAEATKGQWGEPMNVLYLAAEDDWERELVGRARSAGVDLDRLFHLDPDRHQLSFPSGAEELIRWIEQDGIGLVIVDCVIDYMDDGLDVDRKQDAQQVAACFRTITQRTESTIIGIGHTNRGPGTDARSRTGGSIKLRQSARMSILWGKHPKKEGFAVWIPTGSNITAGAPSLDFELVTHTGVDDRIPLKHPHLQLIGESDISADQLLSKRDEKRETEEDRCEDWIRSYLGVETEDGEGWHDGKEMQEWAELDGFTKKTFERARSKLRHREEIEFQRPEPAKTLWRLVDRSA